MRRNTAIAGMAGGIASAAAGAWLAFGLGIALLVLGALLIGVAVLLGWS